MKLKIMHSLEVSEPVKATFALCAYNQENYIREAIEGAFSQTYSPLQIILSDDFSKDSTFNIMRDMAMNYSGPHKLLLNRNPLNLGIAEHVNKLFQLADGDVWIGAAGDDISESVRSEKIIDIFKKNKNTLCVGSLFSPVSESNDIKDFNLNTILKDSLEYSLKLDSLSQFEVLVRMANSASAIFHGATAAYHINVGRCGKLPFYANEDLALQFRAALFGKIRFIDEKLVKYRIKLLPNNWKLKLNPILWCKCDYSNFISTNRILYTYKECWNILNNEFHLQKNISNKERDVLNNIFEKKLNELKKRVWWTMNQLNISPFNLIKSLSYIKTDLPLKWQIKFIFLRSLGFYPSQKKE